MWLESTMDFALRRATRAIVGKPDMCIRGAARTGFFVAINIKILKSIGYESTKSIKPKNTNIFTNLYHSSGRRAHSAIF